MRGIIWFKKDLRLSDNPALHAACSQCPDGVLAIYIIDITLWKLHATSHCQIQFILNGLATLRDDLEKIHIPLIIKTVDDTKQIPQTIFSIAEKIQAQKVFFNREYEVNENKRDQSVVDYLQQHHINSELFDDQLILPHSLIRTLQNDYFKVFTAFKHQWIKQYYNSSVIKTLKKPKSHIRLEIESSIVPSHLPGINSHIDLTAWPAGEHNALSRLQHFIENNLFSYHKERDFPSHDLTSKLSPYLAVGMISARECFTSALAANNNELDTGNQGALTWMSELIWREFYRHILIYVPRICKNKAYKPETDKLAWSYDQHLLQAWQTGNTGFPLVDAAMRQLNQTGWMHNRLRMVVAMFLSKNLFLDWRLGEKYFSEKLIDIDFASNNGGWQWSASTGTDSVPYFRIFNPTLQSQRFDPQGEFIKLYCPELNHLTAKTIHEPINPIIDYKKSRAVAIERFKNL